VQPVTGIDDGAHARTEVVHDDGGTCVEGCGAHAPALVGWGDIAMPKALLHLPCTLVHVPLDSVTVSQATPHAWSW
jgi:hypothetical protein